MAEWWSIDVLHGEFPAFRWQEQYDSALIEAALTNGAPGRSWHADSWGVAFEVLFEAEQQWQAFRDLPGRACGPGAVPDPVSGLLIYRGRGRGEQMPASHAGPSPRLAPALFPARTPSRAAPGPDRHLPPDLAEAAMAGSPAP